MLYNIDWLEAPWLLLVTITGHIVLPEYGRLTADMDKYLDAADGNLYWICDMREISDPAESELDPKTFTAILQSPVLQHPHTGLIMVVGSGAMLRFVVSSLERWDSTSSPVWIVGTLETAEQQCRRTAATDPDRAGLHDGDPLAKS